MPRPKGSKNKVRKLKVGSKVWATKDYRMDYEDMALKRGKAYTIVNVGSKFISTTSEVSSEHGWSKEEFEKVFSFVKPVPKKNLEKFNKLEDVFGAAGIANPPLKTAEDLENAINKAVEEHIEERYMPEGLRQHRAMVLLAKEDRKSLMVTDWILGITLALSGALLAIGIYGMNPFHYLILALSFGYTGYFFGTR